jgi:uncharacterized membrane protein
VTFVVRRANSGGVNKRQGTMIMKSTAAAAASLAIVLAATSASSPAAGNPALEKCFGVAMAGKNDCKAGPGTSCAGTSQVNYQGNAYRLVKTGTCTTIRTPKGPGSLIPKA